MKKKIISLVLAATMIFGASMTVFAETTGDDGAVEITASVETTTIEVEIEKDGVQIIANPYAIEVTVDGEPVTDTLIGTTIGFTNLSKAAVSIGLTGTIEIPDTSDVTIGTTADKVASATSKMVYVQAQVYGDDLGTKEFWTYNGKKAESALVYTAKTAIMSNAPVLAASGTTQDGDEVSEEMYVILTGATSASPTSPWSDTDKFKVTTAYDLELSSSSWLSKFIAPTAS